MQRGNKCERDGVGGRQEEEIELRISSEADSGL